MATVQLTSENFDQVVRDNEIVFIDFWAEWCGPCHMFAPVFEDAAQAHPDIVFGKVDTEAELDLARQFGIMSIPTLAIIRDNIMVFSQPGALPRGALEELVGKVKELDMDEVRQAVAEQSSVS